MIKIRLKSKEEFYNPYNENELHPALGGYIYEKTGEHIRLSNMEKKIVINTDYRVSAKEKELMREVIDRYFTTMIKIELADLKQSNIQNIFLFALGIFMITCSSLFEKASAYIIPEFFLIFGWMVIWELFYGILFYNSKRRLKVKVLKKLVTLPVIINEE